ncbi:hypothetical protein GO002_16685 [Streptomyces eurocidicus]|nr:hypothetical protein [Streptomyces eurocidicus]
MRRRLAELRGPSAAPRPLDARALAALAANPGCRRRVLLDGAGVDKGALARALGSPATHGQSQFAIARGNVFEARVKADGGEALVRLLHDRLRDDSPAPGPSFPPVTPDLSAAGPEGRTARTALALREATAAGRWTVLDHPLLALEVAGTPAYLEPDAIVVHPGGDWTIVEIKSFPMIDGAADPGKVGAAARQAAVYALALEGVAARLGGGPGAPGSPGGDAHQAVTGTVPPARTPYDGSDAAPWSQAPDGGRVAEVPAVTGTVPARTPYDEGRAAAPDGGHAAEVPAVTGAVPARTPYDEGRAAAPDGDHAAEVPAVTGAVPARTPYDEGRAAAPDGDHAVEAPAVPPPHPSGVGRAAGAPVPRVRDRVLLVCPKDFSNLPAAELVDVRKQVATTRRQLSRLTRVEDIAAALPEGTTFDLRPADDGRTPTRPVAELTAAVEAAPAAYAPECLAACELAFHCRARSRAADAVEVLGRGVRGELGGLTTVGAVLAAARGEEGDPADPAVAALRRAAALRAAALAATGASRTGAPEGAGPCR